MAKKKRKEVLNTSLFDIVTIKYRVIISLHFFLSVRQVYILSPSVLYKIHDEDDVDDD